MDKICTPKDASLRMTKYKRPGMGVTKGTKSRNADLTNVTSGRKLQMHYKPPDGTINENSLTIEDIIP